MSDPNDSLVLGANPPQQTTTTTKTPAPASSAGINCVEEAPIDGQQYARENSNWKIVKGIPGPPGPGGGVPEAPNDSKTYGRKNLDWVELNEFISNITTVSDIAPTVSNFGDRWVLPFDMSERIWVPNAGSDGVWVEAGISTTAGGTGAVEFNFPLTPTPGDIHSLPSGNGAKWDGQAWVPVVPIVRFKQAITIACSDEITALTAGAAKVTFRMPFAMEDVIVRASLTTAQVSGSLITVDINKAGVSVLSTPITIDNGSKTSVGATTPPVVTDGNFADDVEVTIDLDVVGAATVAKGLKVSLIGYLV